MISRRNIRTKVMQSLYAVESINRGDVDSNAYRSAFDEKVLNEIQKKALVILQQKLDNSSKLFTLLMNYVVKVAQYAETDAFNKASKYLPTAEDLSISTKIAGNQYIWKIAENVSFQEKIKIDKIDSIIDNDKVKNIYTELKESEAYKNYITEDSRSETSDKNILLHLWKNLMYHSESFNDYISDEFEDWEDDKDMMDILFENLVKKKKAYNFLVFTSEEKMNYAKTLLQTVLEKDEFLYEEISKRLKNWDSERIAVIDFILLKMGIAEFLYFPTIPVKVTINEYIEIAKTYSTNQSGQFVNGILDNVLKSFTEENKIRKIARH